MILPVLLFSLVVQVGELDGTWVQDCARAYHREERISGSAAIFVETNYLDQFCGVAAIEVHSRGSIELGERVARPEGARAIDFRFESVHVVLRHESYLRFFRERRICGFADWEIDVPREVTGLDCGIFRAPAAGFARYGVYLLRGDELFFGRLTPERDASAPERCPISLDPSPYRKR